MFHRVRQVAEVLAVLGVCALLVVGARNTTVTGATPVTTVVSAADQVRARVDGVLLSCERLDPATCALAADGVADLAASAVAVVGQVRGAVDPELRALAEAVEADASARRAALCTPSGAATGEDPRAATTTGGRCGALAEEQRPRLLAFLGALRGSGAVGDGV
ncbi:hypothetical protein KCV87_08375 [Actinosynnema pretiosum subsp. pretiosum]|uniref:Uncharacterized protein n=1 Tax=Actinosynnema pretiosum subsp. pretiosum TaxID=103721 RepID=A0AA45R5K8_9PSEU|nr:hypothetical protein APASM_2355 [Actinosynnema pretiosum subsp. pretiosum]QUF06061.1 hypothetical protein KCV87_08375 [Actinosynnema pretiosum subsp. pretiosum]